jgi:cytochrome c oxidase subunit 2
MENSAGERRRAFVVSFFLALTAGILFVFLFAEFFTARALGSLSHAENAVKIKVIGRQWWWQVVYLDPTPGNQVVAANEIHIPAGKPVELQIESHDVIHSFWIPNLHGKKDLIPGHATTLWLQADRPGRYPGQCAEFCGLQHAHMRLALFAHPESDYQKWLSEARKPAPPPKSDSEKKGFSVFMSKSCAMCHNIGGTPANGQVGPDLTHVAGREQIAANSFPTTRGYLAGWVINPQALKPGAHMPQNQLTPEELHSLLDYLETLK